MIIKGISQFECKLPDGVAQTIQFAWLMLIPIEGQCNLWPRVSARVFTEASTQTEQFALLLPGAYARASYQPSKAISN
jgi:hypothetical protein